MYAVLQISLEYTISREVLESVILATEGLAKPDCARLQRDILGIVAGGLSQNDALGLQAGLRAHGIETEVVSESDLPSLPAPHHPQSFAVTSEGVIVTDYAGQDRLFPIETFVFAAGGHVKHVEMLPQRNMEFVQKYVARGEFRNVLEMVPEKQPKEITEFRVEFYFTEEPFRFQSILGEKTIVRAYGEVLKLRDQNQLDSLLLKLANTLPSDQVNLGIKKVADGEEFLYPSVHAFEEEIVWSFYRMAHEAK